MALGELRGAGQRRGTAARPAPVPAPIPGGRWARATVTSAHPATSPRPRPAPIGCPGRGAVGAGAREQSVIGGCWERRAPTFPPVRRAPAPALRRSRKGAAQHRAASHRGDGAAAAATASGGAAARSTAAQRPQLSPSRCPEPDARLPARGAGGAPRLVPFAHPHAAARPPVRPSDPRALPVPPSRRAPPPARSPSCPSRSPRSPRAVPGPRAAAAGRARADFPLFVRRSPFRWRRLQRPARVGGASPARQPIGGKGV